MLAEEKNDSNKEDNTNIMNNCFLDFLSNLITNSTVKKLSDIKKKY